MRSLQWKSIWLKALCPAGHVSSTIRVLTMAKSSPKPTEIATCVQCGEEVKKYRTPGGVNISLPNSIVPR